MGNVLFCTRQQLLLSNVLIKLRTSFCVYPACADGNANICVDQCLGLRTGICMSAFDNLARGSVDASISGASQIKPLGKYLPVFLLDAEYLLKHPEQIVCFLHVMMTGNEITCNILIRF